MIDKNLIILTEKLIDYLNVVKLKLDYFDKTYNQNEQIKYLKEFFPYFKTFLDEHFKETSNIFDTFDKTAYKENQDYYIKKLWDYLYHPLINKHIYDKPFGYPGDYVIMNYILDYQNEFIGKNCYEKLINHYSLTLSFCKSNVVRKNYIKSQIEKLALIQNPISITSVACGPIREILELNSWQGIKEINCIDFEPKVFEYIRQHPSYEKINRTTYLNFIQIDIKDIVKLNNTNFFLSEQDFIYFSGIFDYLPTKIAKRICNYFYKFLKNNGKMLICNSSKEHKRLHSYYEVLGKWEMIYRTKEDLENIISELTPKKYFFDTPKDGENYLFLMIEKI